MLLLDIFLIGELCLWYVNYRGTGGHNLINYFLGEWNAKKNNICQWNFRNIKFGTSANWQLC
jgi:hypothetical protein